MGLAYLPEGGAANMLARFVDPAAELRLPR
jgi:hypothetical protein